MKKHSSAFVLVVALAAMIAACKPAGDPLVTITGSINVCSAKDGYVLDQAAFDRWSVEQTYNDPWDGVALYKGLLLSKILQLVKASDEATTITLTAKDSLRVTIQITDILQHDILFARWKNGQLLTEETHGPVKVEFPDGLEDSYTQDDWAWWVIKAEIK